MRKHYLHLKNVVRKGNYEFTPVLLHDHAHALHAEAVKIFVVFSGHGQSVFKLYFVRVIIFYRDNRKTTPLCLAYAYHTVALFLPAHALYGEARNDEDAE